MNFFETEEGQTFANITAPSLVEELKKQNRKKQYLAIYGGTSNLSSAIQAELDAGARVVTMAFSNGKLLVVYEK